MREPIRTQATTGLVAIIMITVVLLWQVFRSGPVTGMRIQGAIAAYLDALQSLTVCVGLHHVPQRKAIATITATDVSRKSFRFLQAIAVPTTAKTDAAASS